MKKITIIDGYSLFFRAYYATAYKGEDTILKTSTGTPINAIYTFINMIFPILAKIHEGDGFIVALDTGKKTFRHELLEDYKGTRNEVPHSLIVQFPILRDALSSFNIKYVEFDGYEADDIAGTIASMASDSNIKVELYTSDKDYLQLVSDNITLNLIKKSIKEVSKITPNNFYSLYDINPNQVNDYKGLKGDSSDNLKGIPGIGEKTAKTLLNDYGSLENIYNNLDSLKGKLKENLITYRKEGELCKRLATICKNINLPYVLEDFIYHGYQFDKADNFIKHYELKSINSKLSNIKKIEEVFHLEEDFNYSDSLPSNFNDIKKVSILIDYVGTSYHEASIEGISLKLDETLYYVQLDDIKNNEQFKNFLESGDYKLYCYNYKELYYLFKINNITLPEALIDASLACYLLDSNNEINYNLTFSYFSIDIVDYKENSKLATLQMADSLFKIESLIINELKENDLYELYTNIEIKLSLILAEMEIEGFPISKTSLLDMKTIYENKIEDIKNKIFSLENEFNISSPKQLADVLFLKRGIKSPTKKLSTSIDVLLKIRNEDPIVDLIIEFRKYSKILSTYINGLLTYIKDDDKIHSIFNNLITTTGRLSSSEPNLQNISIKDEEGKQIRKAFFYKDSEPYYLLSYDYSQVELRLLAHLSNCEKLIDAFNNDEDIHEATARHIFKIDNVSADYRRKAKTINFGIVYGISDFGLKEEIGCSLKEAKEIIFSFYNEYPEIRQYKEECIKYVEEHEYIKTVFNRRRYISDIHSDNFQKREFAKRAAMNLTIQGSAADIIKIAMIKIYNLFNERNIDAKLISTIHDELIFKIHKKDLSEAENLIKNIMENVVDLKVKLKVNGGHSKNWMDL